MFGSKLRDLFHRQRAVVVDRLLWQQILAQLAARGRGERESGAFLLGAANAGRARRIVDAIYYDDLDEHCLTGGISFNGSAYGRLWDECAERGFGVVADVHTHPGSGVGQSSIDRAHPMIAQAGHIGLIVPYYAQRSISPAQVGVHQYLGDGHWNSFLGQAAARRLEIRKRRTWQR